MTGFQAKSKVLGGGASRWRASRHVVVGCHAMCVALLTACGGGAAKPTAKGAGESVVAPKGGVEAQRAAAAPTEEEVGPQRPEGGSDFDTARLGAAVREKMPLMQACYQKKLAKHKGLVASFVVHLEIATSGDVSEAVVREPDKDAKRVGPCVTAELRKMHFDPPPSREVEFEYPFSFEPDSAS